MKKHQQESGSTRTIGKSSDVNADASDADASHVDASAKTYLQSKPCISNITKTTIEVCLGPDCHGAGGGAALLEIEELVSPRGTNQNETNQDDVTILPGGCRDFCTVGPNVLVKSLTTGDEHYSKVDGPDACRKIVSSIYAEAIEAEATTTPLSHIDAVMRRREDGIRWKCHRKRAARERRLKIRERAVVG